MTDTHTHPGLGAATGALTVPPPGSATTGPDPVPARAQGAQAGSDDARDDAQPPADACAEGCADRPTIPGGITPNPVSATSTAKTAGEPSPTASAAASAELERLREQAAGLRRTIAGLHSQLAAAQQAHHDDVAAIGARLLEEAEDRGWCEEYDTVIDSLNAVLRVELPLRVRAWQVSFDLRVSLRIEQARNEDDARAQAATLADQIERAVYGMTAVTDSDADDSDDFDIDPTD